MSLPEVTAVLPHRPPFLFVDRVLRLEPALIVAERTFTPEEPFFRGHFPDRPIVPGVILLEGLAQTMAYASLARRPAEQVFLVGVERARFRGVVEPGATVTFEVDLTGEERFGMHTHRGKVSVLGRRVADATLTGYATKGPP